MSKYSLLADCQRRAECCSDALSTVAKTVPLALKMSSDLTDSKLVTQQVKLWISTKRDHVRNLEQSEAEALKTRRVPTPETSSQYI